MAVHLRCRRLATQYNYHVASDPCSSRNESAGVVGWGSWRRLLEKGTPTTFKGKNKASAAVPCFFLLKLLGRLRGASMWRAVLRPSH